MNTEPDAQRSGPRGLILAAFAAIYLIWGSTYLAIRFAVETLPPLLMGGVRFLIAGLILYASLRLSGTAAPTPSNWRDAVIASVFLLGIGNGGVNWAEQQIPSGLAALIIAGTPVWFALFDWLRPNGTRPSWRTVIGIAVGFGGVAMLVGWRTSSASNASVSGIAMLLLASMAWALGSIYAKHTPQPASPLMSAAQQMIGGSVVLLVTGFLLGEAAGFDSGKVAARSAWALVYLTLVGSLIAFTAYAWLLKHTTPARLSTYAYVNPVVAVFLGWALAGEALTPRMLVAATVIVLGVVIITTRKPSPVKSEAAGSAPSLGAGTLTPRR
jgi:drug/metabolite transporter (DMT)-like permease